MKPDEVEAMIVDLNRSAFATFDDWRLPTLEEAMSLMEPEPIGPTGFHMDPIFKPLAWIWTADRFVTRDGSVGAWIVFYNNGLSMSVYLHGGSGYHVLPVRNG
jgi:uncharacterized protein DUF1566